MSYLALQNAWTSAVQPPAGVLGTGLNATMTTAQKISTVNSWTITGSVPASFTTTGPALLNCINWPEFAAISTAFLQSAILAVCNNPGPILGGSANTTHFAPGLFLASFTVGSNTISALIALAQSTVTPWWQASVANNGAGLSAPITPSDLIAAGGLS